jgi:RND superfamily putative drug exporter
MIDFKMMGVGLAVAVPIDATIVRAVLVPSTMKLLGNGIGISVAGYNGSPRIGPEPTVETAPGPAAIRPHSLPGQQGRSARRRATLLRH